MANSFAFRKWVNQRVHEIETGETIEKWLDEQMKPENLKIEIRNGDKWVDAPQTPDILVP